MKIGAERLGWKTIEVPRWFKYSQMRAPNNVARGIRQSMTETFVPAAQAAGCRIVPGVRAEKLERAGTHWQARAVRQSEDLSIGAEAVFVCCGAIETPALLRRGRIQKNIGNSLAFHPAVKVVAVFLDEINGDSPDIGAQQVKEFSPRVSIDRKSVV